MGWKEIVVIGLVLVFGYYLGHKIGIPGFGS